VIDYLGNHRTTVLIAINPYGVEKKGDDPAKPESFGKVVSGSNYSRPGNHFRTENVKKQQYVDMAVVIRDDNELAERGEVFNPNGVHPKKDAHQRPDQEQMTHHAHGLNSSHFSFTTDS
jgi:hypothetical protein